MVAGFAADNPNVSVKDAWVRVPAPSKTETALYMTIENHGSQARAVVSATAKGASKVEMHEMKTTKAEEKQGSMSGMDKSTDKGKSKGGMEKGWTPP